MRGVRVLELSDSLAGAYCTRVLATLGADVVTLEPAEGSALRRLGPRVPDPADHPLMSEAIAPCITPWTRESARSWWAALISRLAQASPKTTGSWANGRSDHRPRLCAGGLDPIAKGPG